MDRDTVVRDDQHRADDETSGRVPAVGATVAAACAVTCFAILTALVAAGVTRGIDDMTDHFFRPHEEWGPTQQRYDHVVEGLSPEHLLVLLAVGTLVVAVAHRSWRPLVLVVPPVVVSVGLTGAVKLIVSRPDPTGGVASGGSYPSGHMAMAIVCGGLLLLLLNGRPPWWAWVVLTGLVCVMALSLLATTAHWLSDVVGGTFLGIAVIAGTVALRSARRTADG